MNVSQTLNKKTSYGTAGLITLGVSLIFSAAAVVVDRKLVRDRSKAKPEAAKPEAAKLSIEDVTKDIIAALSKEEHDALTKSMEVAYKSMGKDFDEYFIKMGEQMKALVEAKRAGGKEASSKLFNESVQEVIGKLKGKIISEGKWENKDELKKSLKTVNESLGHYASR